MSPLHLLIGLGSARVSNIEQLYPCSVSEFFDKHQFKRDEQDMYNKDFTGKDLRKMFKPKVLDDLAATLPDTDDAKEWVDHIRAVQWLTSTGCVSRRSLTRVRGHP